jgi:hypothetical protein
VWALDLTPADTNGLARRIVGVGTGQNWRFGKDGRVNFQRVESIPGMIEPCEAELLYKISQSLDFARGDSVVEFGAFFGRSTNCIAQGLSDNKTFDTHSAFYSYDSFECDEGGGFARHVLALGGETASELVSRNEKKINFFPVFEHYLADYIETGLLVPVVAQLQNSYPKSKRIVMMHVDSPKFYQEFKVVLFRFLPLVKAGSPILFQDFFYQWSASLIAVVSLMIERGDIEIVQSAASTLLCRTCREITLEDVCEIDLSMRDQAIPSLIDAAMQSVGSKKIDRIEHFFPRLTLAKIQFLIERRRYGDAAKALANYRNSGGKINKFILNDLTELIKYRFSLRRLYEIDHN